VPYVQKAEGKVGHLTCRHWRFFLKSLYKPIMVVHICNPSIQEQRQEASEF
jgi:hypothetical protein